MQAKVARFLGKWTLHPEKCVYSSGSAPSSASYTIQLSPKNPQQVDVTIDWKDHEQKPFSVVYHIIPNGQKHPEKMGPMDVQVESTFEGENVLRTNAYSLEGNLLVESTRELVDGGKGLQCVMLVNKGTHKDRVYQYYSKVQA